MTEIPWIKGAFRHVLSPPGMAEARKNNPDEQWYINDHCIIVAPDNRLHWFGITNPYPEEGGLYAPGSHRHIGHAVAEHPFGPWKELEHVFMLPKGTTENIGACFVARHQDEFIMIFGQTGAFHFAGSQDLYSWNRLEVPDLFLGQGTRDPCILETGDGGFLLYGAGGCDGVSAVLLASGRNLINWTPEPPALLTDLEIPWGAMESPFVHCRGEDYYLFLNHSHHQYEETLVFHSRDPKSFDWTSPLCTIFAHAAEIFTWNGKTYITHCGIEDRHWNDTKAPYGLWMSELEWLKL